ncbi:dihydroorotase, partial [Evtepia sp.]|uniref:dihydroorotase n=1 Tax=Evtepia sp. TaxID=2773933 RepID=UPI002A824445
MKLLLNQMTVLRNGGAERVSVLVEDGRIVSLSKETPDAAGARVIELDHGYLFPGFVDVHVHLREPGFSYKETIATGTRAAAHGGYTAVCPMPNLKPVPDSLENLQPELDAIAKDAVIHVHPYGAITVGEKGKELADLEDMAPYVVAFSDDGKGVQNPEMMKQAMLRAKALGKIIVAHCEDESLLNGGYIHDGEYARAHGHRGNPSASEWKQVERDLDLVRETGCAYHVCHVSTKETVALIRKAKAEGLDVTCETTPHYLVFNDSMLQEEGCFKMNPPIRSEEDRQALIAGILDGTVDMIATDHAPHSAEEKGRGLAHSLFGIVGLETAFPVLYTELVKPGVLTLEQLIDRMVTNPARRFGIGSALEEGAPADLTVFDLDASYTIQPEDFLSMGKSSPFAGRTVFGKCLLTLSGGEIAWQEEG